ncbi:MAG: tRNA (adenosine(37)-N6)-threonylcarbamoyltransferase complex dimerization subunit type 1 TsaB [Fimbriimonadaceae bacterium]
MTLCISTSGPFAIIAIYDQNGLLVTRELRESNRAASAAIFEMLESLQVGVPKRIVVDVGPGSFTGVRVGVTIAKMLAHLYDVPLLGVSTFDLVSENPVAIGSKRGEVYVRIPGSEPVTMAIETAKETPGIVMAEADELASLYSFLPEHALTKADPLSLTPLYVANPSISRAKQSHIMGETFGGRENV